MLLLRLHPLSCLLCRPRLHLIHLQDTLDKMIKAFPGKKLRPARNYCEVVPLHAPHTCEASGVLQPPGAAGRQGVLLLCRPRLSQVLLQARGIGRCAPTRLSVLQSRNH